MNLNFSNTPEVFYNGERQKHIYLNNRYAWPYEVEENNSSSNPTSYFLTGDISNIEAEDEVAILLTHNDYEDIALDLSEIPLDEFFVIGVQDTNNRFIETLDSVNFDEWKYFFKVEYIGEEGYLAFYDPVNEGYLYAASNSSNILRTQNTLDDNGLWIYDGHLTAQGTNTRNTLGFTTTNSQKAACYSPTSGNVSYCYFLLKKSSSEPAKNIIKKHAITLDVGRGDLPEQFLSENYCTDWMWSSNEEITGLSSYTPTKPASTFNYWDLNGSNITNSNHPISGDTEVTAVWKNIEYSSEGTIEINGGMTLFYAYSDSLVYSKSTEPTNAVYLPGGTSTTAYIIYNWYKSSYSVLVIPSTLLGIGSCMIHQVDLHLKTNNFSSMNRAKHFFIFI